MATITGSTQRTTFENHFKADVASLLSVSATRIAINSIRSGSVVVDFSVAPDTDGSALAAADLTTTFATPVALASLGISTEGAISTPVTTVATVVAPSSGKASLTSAAERAVGALAAVLATVFVAMLL
jgi:hypothetical protein